MAKGQNDELEKVWKAVRTYVEGVVDFELTQFVQLNCMLEFLHH